MLTNGEVCPVQYKYIIKAEFEIDGIVDREDIIGAIFGQTEGLLGMELDLRELQKQGKLGRIEVEYKRVGNKTIGTITIPTSLKAVETSLIAAAIETVDRVGPAKARFRVKEIVDVRSSKREYIRNRAKELFVQLLSKTAPDIEELRRELEEAYYSKQLIEYGEEKLPAGPLVEKSDEIILVEGRADVVNLVKHGILNVLGMNGINIPKSVVELSKRKKVTLFIDGDRGGELVLRNLLAAGADIDYVAVAPPGREVEELTNKEILKALKSKIPLEQYIKNLRISINNDENKEKYKELLSKVFDTKKAIVFDEQFNIIDEKPLEEIDKLPSAYGIAIDKILDNETYAKIKGKYQLILALDSNVNAQERVITLKDIQ